MARRPMAAYTDEVLRTPAAPVEGLGSEALINLVEDMFETCTAEEGVGLAAPQIGVGERLFVVHCPEDPEDPETEHHRWAIANPVLVHKEGTVQSEEGCLSLPGIRGVVKRARRVVMQGFDPHGQPFEVDAGGLLSRCIQHEIDHLDGVLFIERLSALKRQLLKRQLEELAESA